MKIEGKKIAEGISDHFVEIYEHIRKLEFQQDPDYSKIRYHLKMVLKDN